MTRKYDWNEIQKAYDDGASWRKLSEIFGVSSRAIQLAIGRCEFKTTRSISEGNKLAYTNGKASSIMSKEAREALSIRQSTNNSGGKCKWYEVSGVRVQGTWERNLAIKLNEMGIEWHKVGASCPKYFSYEMDGRTRRYTPDFYLPEHDLFLEVKGYWWGDDKRKMDIVQTTYPNVKFVIIEKEEYNKILQGELVW
jgi:hypothetical protein